VAQLKTRTLLGERFTYSIYPTVPGFFGGGSGQLQLATGGYVISLRGSTPQAVAAAAKRAWARTLDFLRKGQRPKPRCLYTAACTVCDPAAAIGALA